MVASGQQDTAVTMQAPGAPGQVSGDPGAGGEGKGGSPRGKHRVGVYPGTFDPLTNGHIDIISRAARMLDHLIIGVAINAGKGPLFSLEERVELTRQVVATLPLNGTRIDVRPFEGLLVNFAAEQGADVVVRGLRAVSDFEYEFQMAGMNARLNPQIETVFLMASERCHFISSRFVKEIGRLGGSIDSLVSPLVKAALLNRFAQEGQ